MWGDHYIRQRIIVILSFQVLTTLASPVRVGRATAALVVGKLAAIEIPRHLWPDLVDLLLHNIHNAPNVDLKQATFEALGYVCEEVNSMMKMNGHMCRCVLKL